MVNFKRLILPLMVGIFSANAGIFPLKPEKSASNVKKLVKVAEYKDRQRPDLKNREYLSSDEGYGGYEDEMNSGGEMVISLGSGSENPLVKNLNLVLSNIDKVFYVNGEVQFDESIFEGNDGQNVFVVPSLENYQLVSLKAKAADAIFSIFEKVVEVVVSNPELISTEENKNTIYELITYFAKITTITLDLEEEKVVDFLSTLLTVAQEFSKLSARDEPILEELIDNIISNLNKLGIGEDELTVCFNENCVNKIETLKQVVVQIKEIKDENEAKGVSNELFKLMKVIDTETWYEIDVPGYYKIGDDIVECLPDGCKAATRKSWDDVMEYLSDESHKCEDLLGEYIEKKYNEKKYIEEEDGEGQDNEGQDNEGQDNEGQDNEGQDNEGQDNEGQDNEGQDNEGQDNEGQIGGQYINYNSNKNGVVILCNKNVPTLFDFKEKSTNEDGIYLAAYAKDHAFGFDRNIPYYIIERDASSIVFSDNDNLEDDEDYLLDLNTGIVSTDRKMDFCNENSAQQYFKFKRGKSVVRNQEDYEEVVQVDLKYEIHDDVTDITTNVCSLSKWWDIEKLDITKGEDGRFQIKNRECVSEEGYYLLELTEDGNSESFNILCRTDDKNGACVEPKYIRRGYYWNSEFYNGIIKCGDAGKNNKINDYKKEKESRERRDEVEVQRDCEKYTPIYANDCTADLMNQIIDTGYAVYYCKAANIKIKLAEFNKIVSTGNPRTSVVEGEEEEEGRFKRDYTIKPIIVPYGNEYSAFDNPDSAYQLTTLMPDDKYSIVVDWECEGCDPIDEAEGTEEGQEVEIPECKLSVINGVCNTNNCDSIAYDGYHFITDNGEDIFDDRTNGNLVKLDDGKCTVITKSQGFYLNQVGTIYKVEYVKKDDTEEAEDEQEQQKEKIKTLVDLTEQFPLVYCHSFGCRLKKKPLYPPTKLDRETGGIDTSTPVYYYLNQEDYHNLPIITCKEVLVSDQNGENERIIIKCIAKAASYTYYTNGKQLEHDDFIYDNDRTVIECTKGEVENVGTVINCKENKLDANKFYPNRYLIDNTVKGAIRCDGDQCFDAKEIIEKSVDWFSMFNVINGLDASQLIRCSSIYYDSYNCEVVSNKSENTYYYVDSGVEMEKLGLIECGPNEVDCKSINGVSHYGYISDVLSNIVVCNNDWELCYYDTYSSDEVPRYYMNGGTGDILIKVDKVAIEEEPFENYDLVVKTMNSENKNQIYRNNALNGALIICVEVDSCREITMDIETYYLSYSDSTVYIYHYIVVDNEGYWVLDENHIDLDEDDKDEKYGFVINPDDYKILKDNSITGKLVVCSYDADKEGTVCDYPSPTSTDHYYVNLGNYPNANYPLIQTNNSGVTLIDPEVGYYINANDDIILCHPYSEEFEYCFKYIVNEEEVLDEDGNCIGIPEMTSTNGLCIKKGIQPVSVSSAKYLVEFTGVSGSSAVNYLFTLGNNKAFMNVFTEDTYFYVKDSKVVTVKNESDGILYKCNNNVCTVVKQTNPGVYYYVNGDKDSNYPRIKCEVSNVNPVFTCSLSEDSSSEIYCLGGTGANKKLYKCNVEKCPAESEVPNSESCANVIASAGYYLNESDNTKLFNCNGSTCTETKNSDINEGYYITEDPTKPLMKCSLSFNVMRCVYETPENGYYIVNKPCSEDNSTCPLIKCNDNMCEEVEVERYRTYLGNNGLLISCDGYSCSPILKPKEGYYINGNGHSADGKYMIKCSSKKDSKGDNEYSCVESGVINDGYYIVALQSEFDYSYCGTRYSSNVLIYCESGKGCYYTGVASERYYLNGIDNKLIYCKEECNEVESVTSTYTMWYLTGDDYKLIGCKSGVCKIYNSPSRIGYYMNGDVNTSYWPLITYEDGFKLVGESLENGWYRNGDVNAAKSEMIIRCDNANTCIYVEVQDKSCKDIAGTGFTTGFTMINGYLEWCSTDGRGFKFEGNNNNEGKIVTTQFKNDNVIPGIQLIGIKGEHYALVDYHQDTVQKIMGEQYAIVQIYNDKIVSLKSDGYYRYDNKLYECPARNKGVCIEVENVADGYYYNFKSHILYECGSNTYEFCRFIRPEECDVDIVNCGYMFENELFDVENERIYAWNVVGKNFPGVDLTNDNILTDTSKYAVKFRENIDVNCIGGVNKQMNSGCLTSNIEYDYDTNDGYFIFGEEAQLTSVYLKREEENRQYKLYCKINGLCVEKEKALSPIINYKLSEDRILLAERRGGATEVVPLVLEGAYIMKKSATTYVKIVCLITGECEEHEIQTNTKTGIVITNGKVSFRHEVDGLINADKKFSKYVLQKKTTKKDIKDYLIPDEYYEKDTVLEMTYTSYTLTDETRNIFVDSDYAMISTGDEPIYKGYVCKKGDCIEFTSTENEKYFINTVQTGSNINAYVVCNKGGCYMKSLSEDNMEVILPNGAANGEEDALISCKLDLGCEIVALYKESGLPDCKLISDNSGVYIKNGMLYSTDGEELSRGQYCLYNGIPMKSEGYGLTTNIDTSSDGVYMFNEALEMVDISNISTDYINASLYYCIRTVNMGIKCSRTYGYLTGLVDGYAIISKSGCEFTNNKGTCKNDGAGKMATNNEICINSKDDEKKKGDSKVKFYAMSIDVEGSFPEVMISSKVIVGITDKYKFVLNEDGYVLLKGNEIITADNVEMNSTNNLYLCSSEKMNCAKVEKPENGYYKNLFSENAIQCNDGICGTINSNCIEGRSFTSVEGGEYYSIGDYIYKSTENTMLRVVFENYILLKKNKIVEDFPERSTEMYFCNKHTGMCRKVNPADGWYISYRGNGHAIYCEDSICYSKELIKQCTGLGDLTYNNDNYYLCTSKKDPSKESLEDAIGKVVKLDGEVEFFGGSDYVSYGVKSVVGIGNSVLSVKDKVNDLYKPLEACGRSGKCSDLQDGELCIDGDTIYQYSVKDNVTTGVKEDYCTEKEGLLLLYGNKEDSAYVKGQRKDGAQMYECIKSVSSVNCRIVTGYYGDIRCDYNGCYRVSSSSGVSGSFNTSSNKLKVGGTDQEAKNGKYYYISGYNEFPGADGKEGILIQSGEQTTASGTVKYFITFKGDGYYLVGSANQMFSQDTDSKNGNGNLYLCNEKDLECVEQKGVPSGYYKNSAADKASAIILCSYNNSNGASSCKIAENSLTTVGEVIDTEGTSFDCNSDTVGSIVREKAGTVYKICYGDRISEKFTENASLTKYIFMTLKHGNKFANIQLKTEGEKYENDSATILLKVTNRSITQVSVSGYILYNNYGLIDTVSKTSSGTLYYCENKAYEYRGTQKTHQCSEVNDKKSGWYFTNFFDDNRYIRCVDSQCSVVEAQNSLECLGSGSLVYNYGKFRLCESEKKQVDIENINENESVMMLVSRSNEFPGMKGDEIDIIVNRSSFNVTQIKLDSYIVVKESENRKVLSLELDKRIQSDEGNLYKCESAGSCTKITYARDGYYLHGVSGKASQIIRCENRVCRINNPLEGFYVGGNYLKPIIHCIQPGNVDDKGKLIVEEGKTKENIVCLEKELVEGWYVNAVTPGLIRCNNEMGCKAETEIVNGWYINAGATFGYDKLTNRTVTDIIKCGKNGYCNLYETEIEKSCTKGGQVINPSSKTFKVCKSENSNDSVDFAKETVEIIDVKIKDDFPEADIGKTAISLKKEKVVQLSEDGYYYKDSTMYKCENKKCNEVMEDVNDDLVAYNILSRTLYVASCSAGSCTWSEIREEGYYFIQEKDGKDILYTYENDKTFNKIKIYYCKNKDKSMVCEKVTDSEGYMYNPNHSVDGKKDSTNHSNLYVKNGDEYKLAMEGIRKCTEYRTNVCYISYENEPYREETAKYDRDTDLPLDIQAGSVCVNNGGFLYFATDIIDTGVDRKNCVQIPRGSDSSYEYYSINGKVYILDRNGVRTAERETKYDGPSCTYDIVTGNCKTSGSDVLNAGEYCRTTSGMNKLYLAKTRVTSNGGSCVRYEENNNDVEPDEHVERDMSKQYHLINGGLYTVNNAVVMRVEEGVYIVDAVNYKIETIEDDYEISIEEGSPYRLYVCNKEGCAWKKECSIKEGFEYVYDNRNEKVIKCNPTNNTITKINTPGYYVNSANHDLVKCYSEGRCLEYGSTNAMEGYYKDAGNERKMIVCIRDGEEINCNEEDIVECKYNETNGTCSAKKDLLRNSYCYYRKEDKIYGIIEKYIYIHNYIKANKEGECIVGVEKDAFVKARNSKFLGHEERDDLIRISIDSIVSVYEENVGYYLIDTKEGKGVIENGIPEKKTRFYVCRKNNCEEEKPENRKIYINKASTKKMVKFHSSLIPNGGSWEVIDNGCYMHHINTLICDFDSPTYVNSISRYSMIYKEQYDRVTLYDNVTPVLGKVRLRDYQYELMTNTFVEYNQELYLYDGDKQSFSIKEGGPYIFNKNDKGYQFNLSPYKSTRNETITKYLVLPSSQEYELGGEGYYVNKADIDNLGIVIQKMKVQQKLTPPEPSEDGNVDAKQYESEPKIIEKYKAVLNKCTSVKQNVCKNMDEVGLIDAGGVCMITEGEFKGLYLAIEPIKKTSEGRNCIRYEERGSYNHMGKGVVFAGTNSSNNIIKVESDRILPFRSDYNTENGYDTGFYVFEETEDKNLLEFISEEFEAAIAYKCDIKVKKPADERYRDEISYVCETFSEQPGYYYTKPGGKIMEYKNKKWRVVTEKGYYFMKDDYLPADVTTKNDVVDYSVNVVYEYSRAIGGLSIDYNGRYLNKAKSGIVIDYDDLLSDNLKLSIDRKVKECTVNLENGICSSKKKEETLELDDACIGQDGRLYVVDVIKAEVEGGNDKIICYSGSTEQLKYALIGEKSLYMLDGLSIKSMGKGYYVFNEAMESFSSKYPEVPSKIIYCEDEDRCSLMKEKLNIAQDVLVNEAKKDISDSRSLLRYYAAEFGKERLMNVKRNGYYCLDEEGLLRIENGEVNNAQCWTKTDDGILLGLVGCGYGDVCINSAKLSGDVIIENGISKSVNAITVNYEKGYIKLNKEFNLDEDDTIFKSYEGKLYKLKKDMLEHIDEGLYILTSDGRAFVDSEPTKIDGKDICYYINGECSKNELMKYREHKYIINRAANTVVSYDGVTNTWRTVVKDGYYFFFTLNGGQPYSIDIEDRRVYTNEGEIRVKRIIDGEVIETGRFNNGIFITENEVGKLVVERVANQWYDAQYVLNNVESVSRRRCKAIEVDERIDVDEYCYSGKYGVCMPKSTITDKSENESNCISSEGVKNYYYFINGALYIVNDYSYQRISNDGLYIIDNGSLPYAGKMENESTAYLCENGECSNVKDLKSMYYLNIASLELGKSVILYYNESNNSWRRVDEDGNYLFNKNGYGVSAGEEVAYYYRVSKNGNVVERKSIEEGFISVVSKSKEEKVYVIRDGDVVVAKELLSCALDESDGEVSEIDISAIAVGDLCDSNGKLVVVSEVKESGSYLGVEASEENEKYVLVGDRIVVLNNDSVVEADVEGMVVIDIDTMLPLVNGEEKESNVYNCQEQKCVLVDSGELEEGMNYVVSIGEYSLVRYVGEGKWAVETQPGYYFIDDKMKGVEIDVFAEYIYEVYEVNGELKQMDITEKNIVGFFMNRANEKSNIISNNDQYWSEGKKINGCKASTVKGEDGKVLGMVCKTDNTNPEGYPSGDYCFGTNTNELYFLIDAVNNASSTVNCISGKNDKIRYYFDKNNGKVNGVAVSNQLIRIDEEAIRTAENGYYIVDKDGYLVEDVVAPKDDESQDLTIYKCDESGCKKEDPVSGLVFVTNNQKIYEIDDNNVIGKVSKEGLYFFDVDGDICNDANNEVGSIIRIEDEGNTEIKLMLDEMREGAYINDGNNVYVGIYENSRWSIKNIKCEVDVNDGRCSSLTSTELEVGSYCSSEGQLYIVKSIENDVRMCIPGDDSKPIFVKTPNNKLLVAGSKGVYSINEEEGYYAINDETLEALVSEEPVKSQFILCEFGGKCTNYDPEIGRYINRSPSEINIVEFENGDVNEAITLSNKCSTADGKCSSADGALEVGDVCINDSSIYIISGNGGECLKARKAVVTYQLIKNKMYMLTEDAVVQMTDGYFFINGDGRAIINKSDYSNEDTVGYICSNVGDCYDIDPSDVSYYIDYTTKSSIRYNVVKYDPEKELYEFVSEEGIYKLADGYYSECYMNDIDEIECHDIEGIGSYLTRDGEIIKCVENEEGEIECSQAAEGGYYVIDGVLLECNVNEDGDMLVCEEMDKEGYFLTKPDGVLWECVEKPEVDEEEMPTEDIDVSKVLDKLDANGEEEEEQEDGKETTTVGSGSEDETTSTEYETATTTIETTTTTFEEYTPTPVDVVCAPIECKEGNVIYQKNAEGREIEDSPIYVCKKVKDDMNRYETECDSGNYIKGRNGYYICESEREGVDEEKINVPNGDHKVDIVPDDNATTTKKTKSTTTTKEPETTQPPAPTTTKPSQSTTQPKPTTQPTTAGALSMYRKLPTFAFYLIIFILSYVLFF